MNCLNDTVNLASLSCPDIDPTETLNLFTEIIICEYLNIPAQKPDKEHIANTIKNFIVDHVEVIEVDLGDGGGTRKKVIVQGTLKLGIEYSANEPEQQVHFAKFDIPFHGIIGYRPCVPIQYNPDGTPVDPTVNRGLIRDADFPPDGFDLDNFNVNLCLEHEQYHQISHRQVKAVIVVLIWLEPKA